MRIRIEGHDLPGTRPGAAADALRLGNVHVGVQRKSDVVDRVPVSAASAVWEFDVASREVDGLLDVGGPWVHGRPGARFLYLSWGAVSPGGPSPGALSAGALGPGGPSPGAVSPEGLSAGAVSSGGPGAGAVSPEGLSAGAVSSGGSSAGTLSLGGPRAGTPDQESLNPGAPGLGGADGETFAMFRRAKLMFGDVPTALLRAAHDGEGVLTGVLGLTDELGEPVCARVKAIVWELR